MSSSHGFLEPKGLRVTVDRVIYNPDARTPADRPHCFIYVITIHNGTEHAVTIKGRKWVVTNDSGEVTALEGDGVVGQTPTDRSRREIHLQFLSSAGYQNRQGRGELCGHG